MYVYFLYTSFSREVREYLRNDKLINFSACYLEQKSNLIENIYIKSSMHKVVCSLLFLLN